MTEQNPSAGHDELDYESIPPRPPTPRSRAAAARLTGLLTLLDEHNVAYTEEPGWLERNPTYHWYDGGPFGVMIHHTATSSYAPRSAYPEPEGVRTDGRTICNILVQPDGTVNMVSTDPANYSSGLNQKALLDDYVLPRERFYGPQEGDLGPEWYGNRAWINIETVHPGDGSEIPEAQERALIVTTASICLLMGWDATAVVGHYDGRGTKIDPKWEGDYATPPYSIAGIQDKVTEIIESELMPEPPAYRNVWNVPNAEWARNVIDWGIESGLIKNADEHQDDWEADINYGQVWTLFNRMLS